MKMNKFPKQIIQAHRGASGYCYQNTVEAFDKAIEMKADAIELDIRKTKDNKIIVVHDPSYKNINICDWIYSDLVLETKKENFVMPLFIDILKQYKGRILLDIEIKEEGYEEEILNMILDVLTLREFNIRSFSELTVRTIKELNKDVTAILLIGEEFPKYGFFSRLAELFPRAKVRRSKCDMVSPNYQLIILGYVKRMHRIGKPVLAWTVNDEKTMRKMLYKAKVDGIVTNYPDIAIKMLTNEKSGY